MTRRPWLLLAEFVAITLPLAWLWHIWGREAYLDLFQTLTAPLLEAFGVDRFPEKLVRNRFLNVLPFLALMIITPGLSARRRVVGTGIGLAVLWVGQVALAVIGRTVLMRMGAENAYPALLPVILVSDSLPFVLWAAIAHEFVGELAKRALGQGPAVSSEAGNRRE